MNAHEHDTHSHGSDMKAAFLGLIIGALVLFVIVITIVKLTNAKYHEKPAAAETR